MDHHLNYCRKGWVVDKTRYVRLFSPGPPKIKFSLTRGQIWASTKTTTTVKKGRFGRIIWFTGAMLWLSGRGRMMCRPGQTKGCFRCLFLYRNAAGQVRCCCCRPSKIRTIFLMWLLWKQIKLNSAPCSLVEIKFPYSQFLCTTNETMWLGGDGCRRRLSTFAAVADNGRVFLRLPYFVPILGASGCCNERLLVLLCIMLGYSRLVTMMEEYFGPEIEREGERELMMPSGRMWLIRLGWVVDGGEALWWWCWRRLWLFLSPALEMKT